MYNIDGEIEGKDISATKFMRIAVVGPSGVGKSWCAATAPKPWINDFDGRLNSLAAHPNRINVSGKTYYDNNPDAPDAWTRFQQDLQKFEMLKLNEEPIPETFVCDSMQMMCQAAMNNILAFGGKNISRTINAGVSIVKVPNGFDAWEAEHQAVKGAISRMFALGNVICNFHEAAEEAPESTQEHPIYTGRLTVFPVRMKKLLPLFNEKWRLETNNGNRIVYTDLKDYKFNSASTLLLDSIEQPDIAKMFEKHYQRLGK